MLADALSKAERDAIARHVEGCVLCQEGLARLTGTNEAETWRRAERPPLLPCWRALERIVRRLKRMPAWLAPTDPEKVAMPAGRSYQTANRRIATAACERPAVPGYELLGELGRGGMGVVYQARQLGLHRTVALKMVLSGIHIGAKDLARFRAEAGVIARLQHPNIVRIYDVGEVAGRPYFVLEFVNGGSLAQHLKGRPQPVRPAAQLIETLARAVDAAHAKGVIHRDLKPANILLEEPAVTSPSTRGTRDFSTDHTPLSLSFLIPKITDFGVAKIAVSEGEAPDLRGPTVTGEMLGTPNYMAPEQAMVSRQPVGPAADVYSLGAILYELLTGRPPFMGETPLSTVLQVLHSEPVSVLSLRPSVPRDLETICLKCLSKEPRKRYGSAHELAEDVERYLSDEPIRARPALPMERLWRWVRRHPVPAGLLAAGLLRTGSGTRPHCRCCQPRLVRSSMLKRRAQQAELLEEATKEYSRIVERVVQAKFPVNKTVPPTPYTSAAQHPGHVSARCRRTVGADEQDRRQGAPVQRLPLSLENRWRRPG